MAVLWVGTLVSGQAQDWTKSALLDFDQRMNRAGAALRWHFTTDLDDDGQEELWITLDTWSNARAGHSWMVYRETPQRAILENTLWSLRRDARLVSDDGNSYLATCLPNGLTDSASVRLIMLDGRIEAISGDARDFQLGEAISDCLVEHDYRTTLPESEHAWWPLLAGVLLALLLALSWRFVVPGG